MLRAEVDLALASAFAGTASRYWLGVFPLVGRELRHWHERARQIPDPVLRRLALLTQRVERGNLEGAAAYAVLVPRAYRARVVRAVVAFQTTYDYVDTLAEQPSADPVANGRQLHLALLSALDPDGDHPDYYEHSSAQPGQRLHQEPGRDLPVRARRTALVRVGRRSRRCARPGASSPTRASTTERRRDTRGALASWGAAVTPPAPGCDGGRRPPARHPR